MNKKNFILVAFALLQHTLYAAITDTVETYSPSMKKNIKAVVIRPDNYNKLREIPVVYLLHGYSGNYSNWAFKGAGKLADQYQTMIVCPDGNYDSWYWDSPIDSSCRYETYIATELVNWIDSKYKTIKNRKGRAITGLSMGGHGALYLALNIRIFWRRRLHERGVDTPLPKQLEYG